MKLIPQSWIAAACLAGISLFANAQKINDGTTSDGLAKVSNSFGANDAAAELAVSPDGTLEAAQIADGAPFFAVRNAWYPESFRATNAAYSVSADFKPAEASGERRGGVIGWLNTDSRSGIAFYVRPAGGTASFRVAFINFLAESGVENEGADHLFNLDGTSASFDPTSATAGLDTYDPAKWARFTLQFSVPTAADQTALTNTATARLTAAVTQLDAPGASQSVTRTIELLTDLPLPALGGHRFGYFGSWGSLSGTGPIGNFDNLDASGAIATTPNLSPTVTLTRPASALDAIAPASIELEAEASDPDGTIARVEFLDGNTVIATDSTAPYQAVWTGVLSGFYEVRARAIDNRGAATLSAKSVAVFVDDNQPPAVAISKPAHGTSFKAPALVEVTATATDIDGKIARVDIFGNGILLGSLTEAPYTVSWDLRSPGTNTLFARATDDRGATKESASVTVIATSNFPPLAEITSPAQGATFKAPANIRILAKVSDPDGQVVQVAAFGSTHDQVNVVTAPSGGSLPALVALDWNNVPEGNYSISVVATDNLGGKTTSLPIDIVVTPGGSSGNGPTLQAALQGTSIVVSWPAAQTGYRLQSTTNLDVPSWSEVASANNRATVPLTGSSRYFRLVKP